MEHEKETRSILDCSITCVMDFAQSKFSAAPVILMQQGNTNRLYVAGRVTTINPPNASLKNYHILRFGVF